MFLNSGLSSQLSFSVRPLRLRVAYHPEHVMSIQLSDTGSYLNSLEPIVPP